MDSPHSLSSAFPEVSFTTRQKHSSFCLKEASRTGDLSLSLWIVFRLSETPRTLRLFTDSKVFSNDLHFPSLIYPLSKIDDLLSASALSGSSPGGTWGKSRCSHNKCMLSTCSGAVPGTEIHLRARQIRGAASWSSHFSEGDTGRKERGKGEGEGREEKWNNFVLWRKHYEENTRGMDQAGLSGEILSWDRKDTKLGVGITI